MTRSRRSRARAKTQLLQQPQRVAKAARFRQKQHQHQFRLVNREVCSRDQQHRRRRKYPRSEKRLHRRPRRRNRLRPKNRLLLRRRSELTMVSLRTRNSPVTMMISSGTKKRCVRWRNKRCGMTLLPRQRQPRRRQQKRRRSKPQSKVGHQKLPNLSQALPTRAISNRSLLRNDECTLLSALVQSIQPRYLQSCKPTRYTKKSAANNIGGLTPTIVCLEAKARVVVGLHSRTRRVSVYESCCQSRER